MPIENDTAAFLNIYSFQNFMFQKVRIAEIDQLWPHGRPNCTWSIIVNDLLGECSIPPRKSQAMAALGAAGHAGKA